MTVVRRTNSHDVYLVTKVVQHFAKVLKLLCIRKLTPLFCQGIPIHIAQTDDRHAIFTDMAGITATFSANSNTCCSGGLQSGRLSHQIRAGTSPVSNSGGQRS